MRANKNAKISKLWKATNLLKVDNAKVELNQKFPAQNSNQGIGFGSFNSNPTKIEKRNLITKKASHFLNKSGLHIHSPSKDKVSGCSGQRIPSHLIFPGKI